MLLPISPLLKATSSNMHCKSILAPPTTLPSMRRSFMSSGLQRTWYPPDLVLWRLGLSGPAVIWRLGRERCKHGELPFPRAVTQRVFRRVRVPPCAKKRQRSSRRLGTNRLYPPSNTIRRRPSTPPQAVRQAFTRVRLHL